MRLQFFFGTLHSSIALFVPHKSLEGKGGLLSPTWWSQSHGQVPLPRWSDTAMDAHIPATPLRLGHGVLEGRRAGIRQCLATTAFTAAENHPGDGNPASYVCMYVCTYIHHRQRPGERRGSCNTPGPGCPSNQQPM